jgi:molecular chaperone GrpE (heat shock protein)
MTIKPVIFLSNFKEKRKRTDKNVAEIKKRAISSFFLRLLSMILLESFNNGLMLSNALTFF